jgi:hypothetical protein
VSCVIGEARVGIIDRSFIQERPLDCAWRSGKHESAALSFVASIAGAIGKAGAA